VCAPEVKKKFQKCETKKRCTPEKYFVGGLRNKSGASTAVKRALCCGAGVSAAFFSTSARTAEKSPAGRRRHEKPAHLVETQE
jgi:hypothetical protein